MRALTVALMAVAIASAATPRSLADGPDNGPPTIHSSLQAAVAQSQQTGSHDASGANVVSNGGPEHTYVFAPSCALGGASLCVEGASTCFIDGEEGVLYDVYVDGAYAYQSCRVDAPPEAPPVVTPGLVATAFRRLHWPSSDVLIEPPGGRTLVNFATNFHTDNADPSRQTVRLLGRRVTIEATPTTYSWHFGDGTSLDTEHPGSAYPALDITHDYASKGSMSASVDTTYSGRYRVGNGPWLTIPATLTVDGAGVALTVTTARPTLVQP